MSPTKTTYREMIFTAYRIVVYPGRNFSHLATTPPKNGDRRRRAPCLPRNFS